MLKYKRRQKWWDEGDVGEEGRGERERRVPICGTLVSHSSSPTTIPSPQILWQTLFSHLNLFMSFIITKDWKK
jgi:hypothetical protein